MKRRDLSVEAERECRKVGEDDQIQLDGDDDNRAIPLQPLAVAVDGPLKQLNERSSHASEDLGSVLGDG